MITDTDLIGIISASCVMLAFIAGLIGLLARKCYTRMERMKRERIVRKAMQRQLQRDVANNLQETYSLGSISEVLIYDPNRISSYRPKIFGEDEDTLQYEYIPLNNIGEREARHGRARQPHEDTDRTEVKKGVSVIHVNDGDINRYKEHGRPEVTTKSQAKDGYIPFDYSHDEITRDLWQHEEEASSGLSQHSKGPLPSEYRNHHAVVEAVNSETVMRTENEFLQDNQSSNQVHSQFVNVSEREPIKKHSKLQNVFVGADGKPIITNSEQRILREYGNEGYMAKRQTADVHPLITPAGVEVILGHIITQNITEGDKNIHSSMSLDNKINVSDYDKTEDRSKDTFQSVATRIEGRTVHILNVTEEQVVEEWVSDDDEGASRSDQRQQTSDIIASDHHVVGLVDSVTNAQNSIIETMVSDPTSEQTNDREDAADRRQEDSISVFYNDSKNYKVIKKHSAHKPPDWLVKTYAESAASVDVDQVHTERTSQAVQTVKTAIVTSTSPYSHDRESPNVDVADVDTTVNDNNTLARGHDNLVKHPEPDYPDDVEP